MNVKCNSIIAIIRGVKASLAPQIVEVLLKEGINCIEVSLSDENMGLECIRSISKNIHYDNLRLGVGTVINKEQVNRAVEAGAQYIITPGWDRELVRYIKAKEIDIIPGVFSPSDVMQAKSEGITTCKLYPANILGADYIKSLRGPFPDMKFVAVGGVNKANVRDFMSKGFVSVGIGNSLVPRGATNDKINDIIKNAKDYIKLINMGNDRIEKNK